MKKLMLWILFAFFLCPLKTEGIETVFLQEPVARFGAGWLCKFALTTPRLLIGGFDGVWLFDTQTWQPIRKLDVGFSQDGLRPFFSPDGEKLMIISGSGDSTYGNCQNRP